MTKNKRKQGDGTMRLRSDGRWEGRIVVGYDENGKPKTKNVTAKTKFECEEKLAALKDSLGRLSDRIKPDMPFGDWLDLWYQYYCKPAIRATTIESYENYIYRHIIPEIGKIPLNRLTQNDLQQFYARQKKSGRIKNVEQHGTSLSDRVVRGIHFVYRSALERATADGLVSANVALGCKLPPKKGREMQILTPKEVARFLARAKEEGYYEMFLLELTTGMRRGEILGLKWSDLNMRTGVLRIERQISTKGEAEPKTKASTRTIIIPPEMLAILAKMKKESRCDWIFPSPVNDGEPRSPSAVLKRFKLILERSGCKKIRFHDLRHTFATMALENGMDVKTLSAMIGHVSAETTLNIYSHITDTMREQASIKIDRKIGGTDAPMPEPKQTPEPPPEIAEDEEFEPYVPKVRKSGTGCIYQVNANLWEGSFYPRLPDGKRKKFNVYAKTREECEKLLAELIEKKKTEIAEMKEKMKTA